MLVHDELGKTIVAQGKLRSEYWARVKPFEWRSDYSSCGITFHDFLCDAVTNRSTGCVIWN